MNIPDKIERIEQRGPWDCGNACLAMVTGLDLDEIERRLNRLVGDLIHPQGVLPVGLTLYEMTCVLWDLRIRHLAIVVPRRPDVPDPNWYDLIGNDLPVIDPIGRIGRHIDRGGRAIMAVNALRHEERMHWIVAQGHALFDPAPANGGDSYTHMSDFNTDRPMAVGEAVLIG